MFVTLDVSKLSGWLKAAASYRVEREACTRDAGRSVRAGRLDIGRGAGASGMCTGRARLKAGAQGTRVAHPEHPAHVRDLGRVEAQRLVERQRGLPSRKAGMRSGKRCGPGGVKALGVVATQAAYTGMDRHKAGGQGTRGAHVEHAAHVRDLGRVEAERLVERSLSSPRLLPSGEARACNAGRGAAREV